MTVPIALGIWLVFTRFFAYQRRIRPRPRASLGAAIRISRCALLPSLLIANVAQAQPYADGRPAASLRMSAQDAGIVLRHGPEDFDRLGARDVWVFRSEGHYYMTYDAAGPTGWLCALAHSSDLLHWDKQGLVMTLGAPGTADSKSASYCTTYPSDSVWHVFYLGTQFITPAPARIPMPPYLTLKATGVSPRGPWTKHYEVTPFRPTPGTFYSASASPGSIVKQGDKYLQFFSGASLSGITAEEWTSIAEDLTAGKTPDPRIDVSRMHFKRTIGIARTRDLDVPWTVDPQPILPPEEQLENAALYYEPKNETWFLFANHIGYRTEYPLHEYGDAVWVYWSKDLEHWDPRHKAVVVDGSNAAWSKYVHGLPSVIKFGKRLAIFYDGVTGEKISDVDRDIGLAWLDLPLEPPVPAES